VDWSIIFQLRNKKFWWVDVIFYFAISLLVATIFCYAIFIIKNGMLEKSIKDAEKKLQEVGTAQQKGYEKEVIMYQRKINDFNQLIANHGFASNAFAFMEQETRPNVWFKQFSLSEKSGSIGISGEADDMEAFARQTAVFEKNDYVTNIGGLSSTIGQSARVQFNFNLTLSPKIFDYSLSALGQTKLEETETPTTETPLQPASLKIITLFNLSLTPEVKGIIDQTNHTISLDVPYGTDIASLVPVVNVSTGTAISPESGVVQNFRNSVIYKVTGQDGTSQDYKVTVNILSKPKAWYMQTSVIITFVSVSIVIIIIAAVAIFLFIRMRKKKNDENSKENSKDQITQ
jgi:hypothetical protein